MVLIQTSGSVMFHMLYWVCQIYGIFTDWHYSCITSVGLLMLAGDYCSTATLFLSSHVQEYVIALSHGVAQAEIGPLVTQSAGPVPPPLSCLLPFACTTLARKMTIFLLHTLSRFLVRFTGSAFSVPSYYLQSATTNLHGRIIVVAFHLATWQLQSDRSCTHFCSCYRKLVIVTGLLIRLEVCCVCLQDYGPHMDLAHIPLT